MSETWGFFQIWGKSWEKSILSKIPATPYKIRTCRQYLLICFSFPQVSTLFSLCSCKFLFCRFTKNIFCSPSPYINKKYMKKHRNLSSSLSYISIRKSIASFTEKTPATILFSHFLSLSPL